MAHRSVRWALALLLCAGLLAGASQHAEEPSSAAAAKPKNGTHMNIHLRVDQRTEDLVMNISNALLWLAPHDQIYFTVVRPHVSLYLTEFQTDKIPHAIKAVQKLLFIDYKQDFCNLLVTLSGTTVSGSYGMWDADLTSTLQLLSDAVVNATYQWIVPNQPVPDWVKNLPEPARSKKIALVKKYGSPNVFSGFEPHVTLAWDNVEDLTSPFEQISALHKDHVITPPSIGFGEVGNYGTVLRAGGWGTLPFPC
ncbi:RWD domain-containing protein [Balamuthia mandrillaris]